MLSIIISLWTWVGFVLGFVALAVTQPGGSAAASAAETEPPPSPSDDVAQLDPDLYDRALMHARTMSISSPGGDGRDALIRRLREGNVEALYEVARSLNERSAGDDRVTSVQLWHALADGPAMHVPSAAALGFSYADVDKERSLMYFIQASRGKEDDPDGGPHQAALFNAGRTLLELGDAASSLAYIRGCASVREDYPAYAEEGMTRTCVEAYDALSDQIRGETISPPGIEDAADMFLYASMDNFPSPDAKEFKIWTRAMEYLEKYAGMADDASVRGKGRTYLLAAQQELEQFQNVGGEKMSDLQAYLVNVILGRIQLLMTAMDADEGGDEL